MAAAVTVAGLEWGGATLTLPGESECGDKFVVERFGPGAMVAMIDALGHGSAAAQAAGLAAQALSQHCREGPLALIRHCHASLRGTRGAAVSVATLDAERRTITWLAIGNVTGAVVGAGAGGQPRVRELLAYGGVVGDRLPEVGVSVVELAVGDTLVLTTDGVGSYPPDVVRGSRAPQEIAEWILNRFAKRTDDAAVLVARLNGER